MAFPKRLRYFLHHDPDLVNRRGLLAPETVNDMREWRHGDGFSLNADVTVPAWDRTGLERLLRYHARPIFASERLRWFEQSQRLMYQLPKPRPDGQTVLSLTPLEFLDKLTVLMPPPRKHRHRYHGVLAPNAPLRQSITAYAGLSMNAGLDETASTDQAQAETQDKASSHVASLWAMLIARIYKVFPLVCPQCGSEMRIVAFLTEAESIQRILSHINEPMTAPEITPARGPPDWEEADFDQTPDDEDVPVQSEPDYDFDQTVSW